jgi:hypothetical protein
MQPLDIHQFVYHPDISPANQEEPISEVLIEIRTFPLYLEYRTEYEFTSLKNPHKETSSVEPEDATEALVKQSLGEDTKARFEYKVDAWGKIKRSAISHIERYWSPFFKQWFVYIEYNSDNVVYGAPDEETANKIVADLWEWWLD